MLTYHVCMNYPYNFYYQYFSPHIQWKKAYIKSKNYVVLRKKITNRVDIGCK